VLWADAIFVRDFSTMESLTNTRLLKTAVILHEPYLSYELVIFILLHLDRRLGSNLVASYNEELKNHPTISRLYLNKKENSN